MATKVMAGVLILLAVSMLISTVVAEPVETFFDESLWDHVPEPVESWPDDLLSDMPIPTAQKELAYDDLLSEGNSEERIVGELPAVEVGRSQPHNMTNKCVGAKAWPDFSSVDWPCFARADEFHEQTRMGTLSKKDRLSASSSALEEANCDNELYFSPASESTRAESGAANTSSAAAYSADDNNIGVFTFVAGALLFVTSPWLTKFTLSYYVLGSILGFFIPAILAMLQILLLSSKFLRKSGFGVLLIPLYALALGTTACIVLGAFDSKLFTEVYKVCKWYLEPDELPEMLVLKLSCCTVAVLHGFCGFETVDNWVLSEGVVVHRSSTFLRRCLRILSLGLLSKIFQSPESQILAVTLGLICMGALEVIQLRREREWEEARNARRRRPRDFQTAEDGSLKPWAREVQASYFHWWGTDQSRPKRKIDLLSSKCTKDAMQFLLDSPEYNAWKNGIATPVFSLPTREERTVDDIEGTANM